MTAEWKHDLGVYGDTSIFALDLGPRLWISDRADWSTVSI